MDTDLSTALALAHTVSMRQSVALAVVKKTHELDLALAQMVEDTARTAPPPGQGRVVDKLA